MRRSDADDDVGVVDERRRIGLDELDPPVEAAPGSGENATVEGFLGGIDPGAGRRRVRGEDPEQELPPAAAEVEHVVTGRDRQCGDERRCALLGERGVERQPGVREAAEVVTHGLLPPPQRAAARRALARAAPARAARPSSRRCSPGRFIRASEPSPSTSCTGTTASAAREESASSRSAQGDSSGKWPASVSVSCVEV